MFDRGAIDVNKCRAKRSRVTIRACHTTHNGQVVVVAGLVFPTKVKSRVHVQVGPSWAPLGAWPINWLPAINANVCSMVKHYRNPLRVEQTGSSTTTTTAQGHTNNNSKQDVATQIGES